MGSVLCGVRHNLDENEMKTPCPLCGSENYEEPNVDLMCMLHNIKGNSKTILQHLFDNAGKYVTCNQLVNLVYRDDPDGGPLNAEKCVMVTMNSLRKKLKNTDYMIPISVGQRSGYTILKKAVDTSDTIK